MTVIAAADKAQIVQGAADILFLAGFVLMVWGLIAPQHILFFTKRPTRLRALAIGACLTMFFVGIAVYAQTGDLALDLIFGTLTVGLVYHASKLGPPLPQLRPATNYIASSGGRPPAPFLQPATLGTALAQVTAIRATVPAEQQLVFDQIYETCMSTRSLFGAGQVARNNIALAQRCVGEANRVWRLKTGPLPDIEIPLPLDPDETCVWRGYGHRQAYSKSQQRKVRRNGKVKVSETTGIVPWPVDNGALFLTNKRLIYVGGKQTLQFANPDIQSLVVDSYGLKIAVAQGETCLFDVDHIDDPFDKRLTSPFEILWNRLRKRQGPGALPPAPLS